MCADDFVLILSEICKTDEFLNKFPDIKNKNPRLLSEEDNERLRILLIKCQEILKNYIE